MNNKQNVKNGIFITLLLIIGVIIFYKSLSFGYVPYDDPAYVSENHFVSKGLSTESIRWAFLYDSQPGQLKYPGAENLWHPLTWLSHMLDVEIFGVDNPSGHHATNLLLYLLTIPLVFWASRLLLGNAWAGFIVALLWMAHPMKVESVAWISERKDVLSGLFFWASLCYAIKSLNNAKKWYWLGLTLFILAMLSKPSVVILPALLILISRYVKNESRWDIPVLIKEAKYWWLWFASAAVVAIITISMQGSGSHEYFIQQSSLMARIEHSGTGFWYYIYRTIIPIDLNFHYPFPHLPKLTTAFALLTLGCLSYMAWTMRNKWNTFFLGFCWFILCWLPVSGIFYVGASFTADRYMYLASAGILFPLAKFLSTKKWANFGVAALALIWASLSWLQVSVWKDGWSLFKHSTIAQPKAAIGWSNLGTLHKRDQNFTEATNSYQKAIEINPLDYIAYYNIGLIKANTGDIPSAVKHYEKSLEIYPGFLSSALNLGLIKKQAGELEQARELFYKGINSNVNMLWLACETEMLLGNTQQAKLLFLKLESIKITNPAILNGMNKMRTSLPQ